MIKYFSLFICILSFTVSANQKAITDEGETVILKPNGAWEYENKAITKNTGIPLNKNFFFKRKAIDFFSYKVN